DFGAKGDGASDDTAAIQAAINSVSHAGGGTLRFPPGVYLIATQGTGPNGNIIQLASNVAFQGTGREGTEIRMAPTVCKGQHFQLCSNWSATNSNVFKFPTLTNISFRDMTINANGSAGNGSWSDKVGPRSLLQFGDTSNVTVERVDFKDTDVSSSIFIGLATNGSRGTKTVRVADCTFANPTGNNSSVSENTDNSQVVSFASNTVITR